MEKLTNKEFGIARQLLNQISYQTVLETILGCITPGEIYVDNKSNPNMVFAQFKQRTFLSGEPAPKLRDVLRDHIKTNVHSHCQRFNVPYFRLTVNDPQWFDIIEEALDPKVPIIVGYHCYQKTILNTIENFYIPEGFEILPVDQELINSDFPGKVDLIDEMCSERESVNAFLDNSFGVAAFKDGALAGWCLSEYNFKDQCEVGIATLPTYQKLGLAKAMTIQFTNQAFAKGIQNVLWHCFESNEPSWRTALSTGFSIVDRHKVLMLYWDPALHFAVHGNIDLGNGDYQTSLIWFKKALHEENAKSWMAFNAACAAAHLDSPEKAFDYVNQAIDLGFYDLDYLVENKHLESLKNHPEWDEVIFRINQRLTYHS